MLAGILCLCVLGVMLAYVRSGASAEGAAGSSASTPAGTRSTLLGASAVIAANLPLFMTAPWATGSERYLGGDIVTHAHVAIDIAEHGLPHGWLDSYLSGFPFAHHYPVVGWLSLAALIVVGVSPSLSAWMLGTLATLATPIGVYLGTIHCRARPSSALAGALFVSWVSPYNPFFHSYETYYRVGLLSQALATPMCVLLVAFVVGGRRERAAIALAALAMATHPQLTVATLVLLGASLSVTGSGPRLRAGARVVLAGVISGAALYGQGLATLAVPFGWPPQMGWAHVGFPAERLEPWLVDGEMLDSGRPPVLTALWSAASATLVFRWRRPAARASLVATLVALLLLVSGGPLARAGPVGALALSFLQPLRAAALVPIAAATTVVVALEELRSIAGVVFARTRRPRLALWARLSPTAVTLALSAVAAPNRIRLLHSVHGAMAELERDPCGGHAPAGYDRKRVRAWLASVPPGRLWYRPGSAIQACGFRDALDLAVPGGVAVASGVGSHVGVQWAAFRVLAPERRGSARRAEALGVRYLLEARERAAAGWIALGESGDVRLLATGAPTNIVGVGCISETWTGGDRALRTRLLQGLSTPEGADRLLDPTRLVRLVRGEGPVRISDATMVPCSVHGARVTEVPREAGALEATVESPTPVHVVFRATAFPSWQVTLDGRLHAKPDLIAPGFFAVHVPQGHHHLVATAGFLPGYGWILLLGLVGVAACAWAAPGSRKRRRERSCALE